MSVYVKNMPESLRQISEKYTRTMAAEFDCLCEAALEQLNAGKISQSNYNDFLWSIALVGISSAVRIIDNKSISDDDNVAISSDILRNILSDVEIMRWKKKGLILVRK